MTEHRGVLIPLRTLTICGATVLAGVLACIAIAAPSGTLANIGLTAATIAAISAVATVACFIICDRIERAEKEITAEQRRLHHQTTESLTDITGALNRLHSHTKTLEQALQTCTKHDSNDINERLAHVEGAQRRLRRMAHLHLLDGVLLTELDPHTEPTTPTFPN